MQKHSSFVFSHLNFFWHKTEPCNNDFKLSFQHFEGIVRELKANGGLRGFIEEENIRAILVLSFVF